MILSFLKTSLEPSLLQLTMIAASRLRHSVRSFIFLCTNVTPRDLALWVKSFINRGISRAKVVYFVAEIGLLLVKEILVIVASGMRPFFTRRLKEPSSLMK